MSINLTPFANLTHKREFLWVHLTRCLTWFTRFRGYLTQSLKRLCGGNLFHFPRCSLCVNKKNNPCFLFLTGSPGKHTKVWGLLVWKDSSAKVNCMLLFWWTDSIIHRESFHLQFFFFLSYFNVKFDPVITALCRHYFVPLKDFEVHVSYRCSLVMVWKPFLFLPSFFFFIMSLFFLSHVIEWINVWRRVFLFREDKTVQWRGIKEWWEEWGDGGGATAYRLRCLFMLVCYLLVIGGVVTFDPGTGGPQQRCHL